MSYAKYAYSIKTERVREPDFPYDGRVIDTTETLVKFVSALQRADNEKLIVIYQDVHNKVIGLQITEGTCFSTIICPRNIVRQGLLLNAAALLLVHNHPSGNVNPSSADVAETKRLIETAKMVEIQVHDHVIIAGDTGRFFSLRENGGVNFN